MMGCARVHLVVEVVEHAGDAPGVRVFVVAAGVGAHRGFDGAGVLAEAVALGELGEDRPGLVAREHWRRVCCTRHLSMDSSENTQTSSSYTEGLRRSVESA